MIVGSVTVEGFPAIPLSLAGKVCERVIDTGFNGDVELSESLRSLVSARFSHRSPSILAAGQRVDEDVFLTDFHFDGETVQVEASSRFNHHSDRHAPPAKVSPDH